MHHYYIIHLIYLLYTIVLLIYIYRSYYTFILEGFGYMRLYIDNVKVLQEKISSFLACKRARITAVFKVVCCCNINKIHYLIVVFCNS